MTIEQNTERDNLVAQLIEIRKQEKEISDQIIKIDREERFTKNNNFVGKFFKKDDDYPSYIFIYGIDKESCELQMLSIYDISNGQKKYFSIQYQHTNDFARFTRDDETKEVSKEEFDKCYKEIQQIIKNIYENTETTNG